MERERWTELSKAVSKVAARWKESSRRHTHATALIAQVHLWAAAHDRPISWACVSENWESRSRPKVPLADQSTMSRRTRTRSFTAFMDAVGQQMNGDGGGDKPSTTTLIKRIDGKALVVAAHSKDPNAAWGRGAGQKSKGYKLHTIWANRPMPEQWAVTPLNVCEKKIAARLIGRLNDRQGGGGGGGGGYLLGDAYFDANDLYDRAAKQAGCQLVAPRRMPGTGLGKGRRRHSPSRLRSIDLTEPPGGHNRFGPSLRCERLQIERDFGNLSSFGGGLSGLPAWSRRIWRVRAWVQAKLLINAARILCRRRALAA
jgi:hypothetical protein